MTEQPAATINIRDIIDLASSVYLTQGNYTRVTPNESDRPQNMAEFQNPAHDTMGYFMRGRDSDFGNPASYGVMFRHPYFRFATPFFKHAYGHVLEQAGDAIGTLPTSEQEAAGEQFGQVLDQPLPDRLKRFPFYSPSPSHLYAEEFRSNGFKDIRELVQHARELVNEASGAKVDVTELGNPVLARNMLDWAQAKEYSLTDEQRQQFLDHIFAPNLQWAIIAGREGIGSIMVDTTRSFANNDRYREARGLMRLLQYGEREQHLTDDMLSALKDDQGRILPDAIQARVHEIMRDVSPNLLDDDEMDWPSSVRVSSRITDDQIRQNIDRYIEKLVQYPVSYDVSLDGGGHSCVSTPEHVSLEEGLQHWEWMADAIIIYTLGLHNKQVDAVDLLLAHVELAEEGLQKIVPGTVLTNISFDAEELQEKLLGDRNYDSHNLNFWGMLGDVAGDVYSPSVPAQRTRLRETVHGTVSSMAIGEAVRRLQSHPSFMAAYADEPRMRHDPDYIPASPVEWSALLSATAQNIQHFSILQAAKDQQEVMQDAARGLFSLSNQIRFGARDSNGVLMFLEMPMAQEALETAGEWLAFMREHEEEYVSVQRQHMQKGANGLAPQLPLQTHNSRAVDLALDIERLREAVDKPDGPPSVDDHEGAHYSRRIRTSGRHQAGG